MQRPVQHDFELEYRISRPKRWGERKEAEEGGNEEGYRFRGYAAPVTVEQLPSFLPPRSSGILIIPGLPSEQPEQGCRRSWTPFCLVPGVKGVPPSHCVSSPGSSPATLRRRIGRLFIGDNHAVTRNEFVRPAPWKQRFERTRFVAGCGSAKVPLRLYFAISRPAPLCSGIFTGSFSTPRSPSLVPSFSATYPKLGLLSSGGLCPPSFTGFATVPFLLLSLAANSKSPSKSVVASDGGEVDPRLRQLRRLGDCAPRLCVRNTLLE